MKSFGKTVLLLLLLAGLAGLGWALWNRLQETTGTGGRTRSVRAAPVEAAPVERGPIARKRTFSGTLEAPYAFMVAPKVAGRIRRLAVYIGDAVQQGQIVAELDDDEFVQAVVQAEAELAVARANRSEARSALEIAERKLARVQTLRRGGVASESDLDAAIAEQLAAKARQEVAAAQMTRAEALLRTARIRLGYTQVSADWSNGGGDRVVAERFVDEGGTVSANTPLLSIVALDPMTAVIFVGEKDYANLRHDQEATLYTDAYPEERFSGRVARIAPVFRQEVRQARVEMTIANPEKRLKPGMFVRATVVLERHPDAVIVPQRALTRRDDRPGVFVVAADGRSVHWRPVTVGIRDGERVEVSGEGLSGRVVTLGHQLVDDGAAVTVSTEHDGGTSLQDDQDR